MAQVAANGTTANLQYDGFYIGLTRDEYVKSGGDVSLFNKIDKYDGVVTGTLTESDMLMYREHEVNKFEGLGLAAAAAATVAAISGGPLMWVLSLVNIGSTVMTLSHALDTKTATEAYLNEKSK